VTHRFVEGGAVLDGPGDRRRHQGPLRGVPRERPPAHAPPVGREQIAAQLRGGAHGLQGLLHVVRRRRFPAALGQPRFNVRPEFRAHVQLQLAVGSQPRRGRVQVLLDPIVRLHADPPLSIWCQV
jgi:hypothetical protein